MPYTLLSKIIKIKFIYRNAHQKTPQELLVSNTTDQYKFKPVDYFVKDTYRTRNLNIRTESRRILVNGKEEERRIRFIVDDTRRVRLSRSESLPNVRRERVRDTKESVVDFRGADRRATERDDRRFLDNRSDERTSRRETRDTRSKRLTTRDDSDARRRTAFIRQVYNTVINSKETRKMLKKKKTMICRTLWLLSKTKTLQHGK